MEAMENAKRAPVASGAARTGCALLNDIPGVSHSLPQRKIELEAESCVKKIDRSRVTVGHAYENPGA